MVQPVGGAAPGELALSWVAPLSSQICTCLVLLLNQTISYLASPLKSPVPATIQLGSGTEPGEPPPIMDAPFNSHINICPLPLLRQRMSVLPSLLKSRCPTIVHVLLSAAPGEPLLGNIPPFCCSH